VERIEEEVQRKFPSARMLTFTSDMVDSPAALNQVLTQILEGGVDIIIGTQMIAKGHHFPNLTLVGVVDGDLGLAGGDLRAAEKTYQLLHQVAGRCGRADLPGEVFIQTHTPEHPVMQALIADDKDAFFTQELAMRDAAKMPPYGRLGAVIVSSSKQDQGDAFARHLMQLAPRIDGIQLYGPAPAPIAKIRKWYRWRFLIHGPQGNLIQRYLKTWLGQGGRRFPPHIKIQMDVDPIHFY
jgi:primosomal protein N' (replication factor Y)